MDNLDLHDELALTPAEKAENDMELDMDRLFAFDPNMTLSDMNHGFRILLWRNH